MRARGTWQERRPKSGADRDKYESRERGSKELGWQSLRTYVRVRAGAFTPSAGIRPPRRSWREEEVEGKPSDP